MPDDVELEINTRTVTPTRGAVVRADYLPKSGRRALMTLTDNDRAVPFGAVVTLVGDELQFYCRRSRSGRSTGMREQGTLVATWGSQSSQQCRADFTLPNH
ncbi:FimD/PapC C-terminal domain-containing protein [Enterobacter hormaechei]